MEKDRSSKIIAVVALLVGVVGLSLGFAAFSNTLTISSGATVRPDATTFNVDFSSTKDTLATEAIEPTTTPSGLTASNGAINNTGDPTITNLSVEFSAPGQSATYTFFARNEGEYDAFLNSIAFANAAGADSYKKCEATANDEGNVTANADLVAAACNAISLSVKVGTEAATKQSVADIDNHTLAKGVGEEIVVVIDYAATVDGDDSARADGPFKVTFGDITLAYGSVDN